MTETRKASPGKKAIEYAESFLNVNEVFIVAQSKREELDTCLTNLSDSRDKKRAIEDLLTDCEMNIIADERGKHPDMSEAAMTRHLKLVYYKNDTHAELRRRIASAASELDGYEMDKIMLETDIKILIARMNELGGYLQYLATIKQAEIQRKEQNHAPAVNSSIW